MDTHARRYRAALDRIEDRRVDLIEAARAARSAGVSGDEVNALVVVAGLQVEVLTRR